MTVHELKTWTEFFWDIKAGRKTFEVRVNDRDFEVGDYLVLREWEAIPQRYTGAVVGVRVTYMCDIRNIMNEEIVGMSIRLCRAPCANGDGNGGCFLGTDTCAQALKNNECPEGRR